MHLYSALHCRLQFALSRHSCKHSPDQCLRINGVIAFIGQYSAAHSSPQMCKQFKNAPKKDNHCFIRRNVYGIFTYVYSKQNIYNSYVEWKFIAMSHKCVIIISKLTTTTTTHIYCEFCSNSICMRSI